MDEVSEKATVTILLLGDPGCGKSTFLSRLKSPKISPRSQSRGQSGQPLELLLDSYQPFVYDIRFSRKSFRLEIYDTASPNQHWSSLQPDVVILAFDISNRTTLDGLKAWRNDITRYFQRGAGEHIPVILIGLKRDLREENDSVIFPQESYRIAQELRCDCYAECSAVTGELVAETFEDIARVAAMTTTAQGGQSEGGCTIL